MSASCLAYLGSPSSAKVPGFLLTTAELSGPYEAIRWSPVFSRHFLGHLSGVQPSRAYILLLPVPRWLFLPGLEGPERGQSGLVCKWEPYCGYLLFHFRPPFALESRGTTNRGWRIVHKVTMWTVEPSNRGWRCLCFFYIFCAPLKSLATTVWVYVTWYIQQRACERVATHKHSHSCAIFERDVQCLFSNCIIYFMLFGNSNILKHPYTHYLPTNLKMLLKVKCRFI